MFGQGIGDGARVADGQLEGDARVAVVDAGEPRRGEQGGDGVAGVDVGIAAVALAGADKVQAVAEVVERVLNLDGDGVADELLRARLAAGGDLQVLGDGDLELLLDLHLMAADAVAQEVVLLDRLLAVQAQEVVLVVVFEGHVAAQQVHARGLELAAAQVDFLELGRLRLDGDGRLALDEPRAEAEVELQPLALDGESAGERRVVVDVHGSGRQRAGVAKRRAAPERVEQLKLGRRAMSRCLAGWFLRRCGRRRVSAPLEGTPDAAACMPACLPTFTRLAPP